MIPMFFPFSSFGSILTQFLIMFCAPISLFRKLELKPLDAAGFETWALIEWLFTNRKHGRWAFPERPHNDNIVNDLLEVVFSVQQIEDHNCTGYRERPVDLKWIIITNFFAAVVRVID